VKRRIKSVADDLVVETTHKLIHLSSQNMDIND